MPNVIFESKKGTEMRLLIAAFLFLFLMACSSNDASEDVTYHINSSSSTEDISITDGINLQVMGDGNALTLAAGTNINKFTLIGSNNYITVVSPYNINYLSVDGSDNTFSIPAGSLLVINQETGLGNQVIEY
jgi:hypothetical protein